MASSKKFHRLVLSVFIILSLLFINFVPALAVEVGNDTINFVAVRYDFPSPGVSTWYYQVISGSQPAISYVAWQLNLNCLSLVDAGTWDGLDQDALISGGGNPEWVDPDPETQLSGVKFDQGFNDGETRYYFFTVNGNYAQDGSPLVASKGGTGFDSAAITAPSMTCEPYQPDAPAIDIEKYINDQDADEPPGVEILEGDPVTFRFVVTNIGDVPLRSAIVSDSVWGGDLCFFATLAPQQTVSCIVNHLPAVLGQHGDIGTVVALYEDQTVTDSDPAYYLGVPRFVPQPALDIEKYVNGEDADSPPGPTITVGSEVRWDYVVTNTGNVALQNILVADNRLGKICTIPSLEPGQTVTCSRSGVAVMGQYRNLGKAATYYGNPKAGGILVRDLDPAYYFGVKPASILDESPRPGRGSFITPPGFIQRRLRSGAKFIR